jgi:2-oxo-4-hydroxy-4-carboxy-5-ureidoimidazoline decarboxylase
MPFIVCVRRHTKGFDPPAVRDCGSTIRGHSWNSRSALSEVFRIAALRLDQRIENAGLGSERAAVEPRARQSQPGARPGVWRLALRELSGHDAPRLIAQRPDQHADGRTDAPLISGRPVPTGQYEILFSQSRIIIRTRGMSRSPSRHSSIVVPIRFSIAEPEGHYHVPLLVTPWSYGYVPRQLGRLRKSRG